MARRAGVLAAGSLFFVLFAAGAGWAQTASPRRDCSDFSTQQQAQDFFTQNGGPQNDPFNLDVDNDGQACEGLPGGTSSPSATSSPGASPAATTTPAPTADSTQTLPTNGAPTAAIALSGLTFLEAGYGMTLAARRIGVRRRALPVYLMRKLIKAAREGQNVVALTDDVYLVRRTQPTEPTRPEPVRDTFMGVFVAAVEKVATTAAPVAPKPPTAPVAQRPVAAPVAPKHAPKPTAPPIAPKPAAKVDWPFFTPSDHG